MIKFIIPICVIAVIAAGCSMDETGTEEDEGNTNGDASNEEEDSVTQIEAEIEVFPFDEAVQQADLIAAVEIVKEEGTIDGAVPRTIFDAEVKTTLKGDEEGSISLVQDGTHEAAFNDSENFSVGDEYVLLLNETDESLLEADYSILSSRAGQFKIEGDTLVNAAYHYDELDDFSSSEISSEDREQQRIDRSEFENYIDELSD